jgi:hypothetical protein
MRPLGAGSHRGRAAAILVSSRRGLESLQEPMAGAMAGSFRRAVPARFFPVFFLLALFLPVFFFLLAVFFPARRLPLTRAVFFLPLVAFFVVFFLAAMQTPS